MSDPTPHDIAQATVCLAGVLDYGERFVIARDRIAQALADQRSAPPIHAHRWVPDLWQPSGELCTTCRERRTVAS